VDEFHIFDRIVHVVGAVEMNMYRFGERGATQETIIHHFIRILHFHLHLTHSLSGVLERPAVMLRNIGIMLRSFHMLH